MDPLVIGHNSCPWLAFLIFSLLEHAAKLSGMSLFLWILRLSLEKVRLVRSLSAKLRALQILSLLVGCRHTLHLNAIWVNLNGRSPILTWHYVSSSVVCSPAINSVSALLVLIILNRWGLVEVCRTPRLSDSASESLWPRNFYLPTVLSHWLITIWLLGFVEFLLRWCDRDRHNLEAASILLTEAEFIFGWRTR